MPIKPMVAATISNGMTFHVAAKGIPGGFCQRRIQIVELPIANEGT